MATYRFLFLLVLQLTGCYACGPRTQVEHKPTIAAEVQGYVDQFLADADSRNLLGTMVNEYFELDEIYLGDTGSPNAIGMCYIGYRSRWVVLDPAFQGSPRMWRTLIYHELGHCLLNLDHYPSEIDIDTTENKSSIDIMNPSLPLLTEEEWGPLVDRLFQRSNNE